MFFRFACCRSTHYQIPHLWSNPCTWRGRTPRKSDRKRNNPPSHHDTPADKVIWTSGAPGLSWEPSPANDSPKPLLCLCAKGKELQTSVTTTTSKLAFQAALSVTNWNNKILSNSSRLLPDISSSRCFSYAGKRTAVSYHLDYLRIFLGQCPTANGREDSMRNFE